MQQTPDLATELSQAIHGRQTIDLKDSARPADLAAAEALQDAVIARLGRIAAWKLGATNQAVRDAMQLPRFFFGALPADRVLQSGCTLEGPWTEDVGVECEYAFRFARNLEPGAGAIDARAVEAAIGGVHAAFEIPGWRYSTGLGSHGGLATVADDGASGWLIVGEQCAVSRVEDVARAPVRFSAGGNVLAEGTAAEKIDFFPFEMLTNFVRLAHSRGYSIKAGQYVVMGSCTGYVKIPLGVAARGDFGGAAKVEAVFRSLGSK